MSEPQNYYTKWKKPVPKDPILYNNSIYMKCPEQANPQRQKADCQLPRIKGRDEELTANEYEVCFGGAKNVLKLDCGELYLNKAVIKSYVIAPIQE